MRDVVRPEGGKGWIGKSCGGRDVGALGTGARSWEDDRADPCVGDMLGKMGPGFVGVND